MHRAVLPKYEGCLAPPCCVPPPRKKRVSRQLASTLLSPLESPIQEASSEKQATGASWEGLSPVRQAGMQHLQVQSSSCPQSSPEFKGSQASLSDSLGVPASTADQDSYSTSSAEEELEFSSPNVKKKPSMILGVTTSVPEVAVMEKILQKLTSMHKAYSPGKKISILLKTCKLIYDSMALGNPGKPYGADDFLPVLMYVLARSNLTEMLLNVEYMMELMDPALQLGEGSYYLTTTYGALEHIKNYDKITVTRQLSVEVQDSIHRWERRRTLNKARASRSSVQDFICVSYLKPEQQSRTLASRADTAAQALCAQCAEKFEVSQPQDYRLFVLVDGRCFQLADEALPHRIKGYLLRSEPKRDFHFVYRPQDSGKDASSQPCIVVREPNFL